MAFSFDLAACAGSADELLPAVIRLVAAEGWPHQAGERFVGLRPELPVVGKANLTLGFAPAESGGGILRVETVVARTAAPAPDALYERLNAWNAEHDHQDLLALSAEQSGEVAITVRAELAPHLGAKEPFLAGDLKRCVERVARQGAQLRRALEADEVPLK